MRKNSSLPAISLASSAVIWGLIWWPLRQMDALGWHPLQSSTILFLIGAFAIALAAPRVVRGLASNRGLWVLAIASGFTNATFNWAIVLGDVVRVVLLFYLMPLWAVVLGRILLKERIDAGSVGRIAMALTGVVIVLWPASGWKPEFSLADGLGLAGGMGFALSSVLLRGQAGADPGSRAFAMFSGSAAASLLLLAGFTPAGLLPPAGASGYLWAAGITAWLLVGNFALQYGAARLPARTAAVIMLVEVVVSTVSSAAMGAGTITPAVVLGAGLILLSGVLAARQGAEG